MQNKLPEVNIQSKMPQHKIWKQCYCCRICHPGWSDTSTKHLNRLWCELGQQLIAWYLSNSFYF